MKKTLCIVLAALTGLAPLQAARAGMITPQQVSEKSAVSPERETVVKTLQTLGVSAQAAQARVAALSDEEAAQLAAEARTAPAAGNAAFIFIALMLFFAVLIHRTIESK